uniref:G-protein coupled receptors family 2 profile 2 domain-containing protein n=1 Tax=Sinocyclocheilus grahami TaxID=75366 RepID=A0A672LX75_SINGR
NVKRRSRRSDVEPGYTEPCFSVCSRECVCIPLLANKAQSIQVIRQNTGSFGKTDELKTGVCGKDMKGTITYKCESGFWKPVEDNCVLGSLLVEEIPVFIADLSSATAQHEIIVSQSAATIQAIVDILFNIADLSQSIFINKQAMEVCIFTFNIKLLSAIEDISDRLTDEFEIYEKYIQLIRTTINNSFSTISRLPNSATEIVIPHVPQETTITIIIFSTFNKVLLSQGTNDRRRSDARIIGDVVVVKVNEMLNNIYFTFDIQSLGYPECVFWNFSLNTWDSTGCEVKHSRNKIMSSSYINYIGLSISMASLIICLIIETIVWKSVRRNDTSYMRHVSIVNIAVSLLIANICFIIGAAVAEQEQPNSVGRCSLVVFFMPFFYLALFFWLLISALLLFFRTAMDLSQMSRAKMMVIAFIVGYGAPLLIAVITVASTAGPQNYISKRNACWLNWHESKALLAFVVPALTIVAINLVVLIVVLYKMLRRGVGAATQPDEKHALVVIARCVAILTPLFGLTWGFGVGTMLSRDFGIHVVFALLNSLQVLLFVPILLIL